MLKADALESMRSLLAARRLEVLNEVLIDQNRIQENYRCLRAAAKHLAVFPVLKSNAYGHGIQIVARLLEKTDAPLFAVDSVAEALEIGRASSKRLLVMGANPPENLARIDHRRLSVAIGNLASLEAVANTKQPFRLHLKWNTGMNRQGFDEADAPAVIAIIKKNPRLIVEGVFSHLADADHPQNDFTDRQQKRFSALLDRLAAAGIEPIYIHLGATAGFLKTTDARINAFRPGIGLYGINPLEPVDRFFEKLSGLRPVMRLQSTVTNVHRLKAGDCVSYNCTFVADQELEIGVIPLGYFEALDRRLSNTAQLDFEHNFYPIAGRVCMNLTCFACPPGTIRVGDKITVIGDDPQQPNSAESIARLIGTIPYEVFTRVERSIRRTIV